MNMNLPDTILIIDDEVQIRRLLEITLTSAGFRVHEATNGKDGLVATATHNPALVILDLGLPDTDGMEILKKLREWYLKPVIILSVRNSEDDIVGALDIGANDYLTKPFRTGEFLARVRAALRHLPDSDDSPELTFGNLTVDLADHVARKNGEIIKLTSTEFSLLAMLARNAGRVLTHQSILREIWGFGYIGQTQYLRVFVAQLRKKIEDDPARPRLLITESGIGYRFHE
jgi:two-component system, OmpR family, KDP operon response regulator KdpE